MPPPPRSVTSSSVRAPSSDSTARHPPVRSGDGGEEVVAVASSPPGFGPRRGFALFDRGGGRGRGRPKVPGGAQGIRARHPEEEGAARAGVRSGTRAPRRRAQEGVDDLPRGDGLIRRYLDGWKRRGMRMYDGRPVADTDLILRIDGWLASHPGHTLALLRPGRGGGGVRGGCPTTYDEAISLAGGRRS